MNRGEFIKLFGVALVGVTIPGVIGERTYTVEKEHYYIAHSVDNHPDNEPSAATKEIIRADYRRFLRAHPKFYQTRERWDKGYNLERMKTDVVYEVWGFNKSWWMRQTTARKIQEAIKGSEE